MDLNNILTLSDAEIHAESQLPYATFNFISGGSFYQQTVKENTSAFKKYKIRPRVLKHVAQRDTSTSILGNKISFPVGIAPSALHKLSHKDGEIATAKACSQASTIMTISMVSNISTRDVTKTCPSLVLFQQIFITKPKDLKKKFVKAAEDNGIKGLVLTVDHTVYPIRFWEKRDQFGLTERLDKNTRPADDDIYNIQHNPNTSLNNVMFDGSCTWDDVKWLKSITHLPIIIKGVFTHEDAKLALLHGADAIWISNHGGRALDSVSASIDVLSEIVKEVDGKCEVYIDGGFRTGIDVFKALALGARAVFVGRPIPYGLAIGGAKGVQKVLDILRNELDNTMALAGCKSLSDITKAHLSTCHHESKL